MEEKNILRNKVKESLLMLSERELKEEDRRIFENVISLEEFIKADNIFVYVSMKKEISTCGIIEMAIKMGKTVSVPKSYSSGLMKAKKITGFDDLESGMMGILEPKSYTQVIEPEEIDFALIPCLACDRNGVRLGYGGGYYDRFLPRLREDALKNSVILCRSRMLFQELPREATDIQVNRIVTGKGILTSENL